MALKSVFLIASCNFFVSWSAVLKIALHMVSAWGLTSGVAVGLALLSSVWVVVGLAILWLALEVHANAFVPLCRTGDFVVVGRRSVSAFRSLLNANLVDE